MAAIAAVGIMKAISEIGKVANETISLVTNYFIADTALSNQLIAQIDQNNITRIQLLDESSTTNNVPTYLTIGAFFVFAIVVLKK